MNSKARVQMAGDPISAADPGVWLRNVGIALAGSALVAVCAHVTLPLSFTPVPLTLQPFAVLLLGLVLSRRLAAATLVAYLFEGAAGLPVFTPGMISPSGLAHLLGPTGGYLIAYPFAVYVIAGLWRTSTRTLYWALISAAAGDLIILAAGSVWLSLLTHASVSAVLTQAVIPFLPGDAVKVAVAAALGFEWYRIRPARRPANPTL